ncbi:MAG: class I SAM-dependent methyltransferase [Pyrinomonadaceae bacterium]
MEVGSGAHGLIFGFANNFGIGIDPLAVEYKSLFPKLQRNARTIAAIGEMLPFDDQSFDIVLSDNVIDHAEHPLAIIDEMLRVLRPHGLLYFTVNVHHPIYEIVSRAHGRWNAAGLRFEISPFADHTVHLTAQRVSDYFSRLPLRIVSQRSTIPETKTAIWNSPAMNPESLLKKLFYKNALIEVIGIRE